MVFSSLEFIFVFLPVFLLVYYMVPMKWKNHIILAGSLIFYGWGSKDNPEYIALFILSIVMNYMLGWFMQGNPKWRKTAMITAVIYNLLPLVLFKAAINRIILPVGISFFTFQALSYVIDVYRADAPAQKNFVAFGTYVTLFPQLIAGPIVRYKDVDDQLRARTHSAALFASGIRTFMAGMAKKVLLANAAGEIWSRISLAEELSVLAAWLGILMYTFQIYFDFSGYSDMAIGLGKMMGFSFRENFYYPYIARSITDFWRRWHISLSTWFREYVYIPLGGNRCGKGRQILNLLAVWLFTGLWHGASWNFVLWGLYYFVLLVLEKTVLKKLLEKLPAALAHIYTLTAVVFGWWLFVFDDFSAGLRYLSAMFGGGHATALADGAGILELCSAAVLLVILTVAATPYPRKLFYKLWEKTDLIRTVSTVLCAIGFVLCVAYLVNSSYNPFLYCRV